MNPSRAHPFRHATWAGTVPARNVGPRTCDNRTAVVRPANLNSCDILPEQANVRGSAAATVVHQRQATAEFSRAPKPETAGGFADPQGREKFAGFRNSLSDNRAPLPTNHRFVRHLGAALPAAAAASGYALRANWSPLSGVRRQRLSRAGARN